MYEEFWTYVGYNAVYKNICYLEKEWSIFIRDILVESVKYIFVLRITINNI